MRSCERNKKLPQQPLVGQTKQQTKQSDLSKLALFLRKLTLFAKFERENTNAHSAKPTPWRRGGNRYTRWTTHACCTPGSFWFTARESQWLIRWLQALVGFFYPSEERLISPNQQSWPEIEWIDELIQWWVGAARNYSGSRRFAIDNVYHRRSRSLAWKRANKNGECARDCSLIYGPASSAHRLYGIQLIKDQERLTQPRRSKGAWII